MLYVFGYFLLIVYWKCVNHLTRELRLEVETLGLLELMKALLFISVLFSFHSEQFLPFGCSIRSRKSTCAYTQMHSQNYFYELDVL